MSNWLKNRQPRVLSVLVQDGGKKTLHGVQAPFVVVGCYTEVVVLAVHKTHMRASSRLSSPRANVSKVRKKKRKRNTCPVHSTLLSLDATVPRCHGGGGGVGCTRDAYASLGDWAAVWATS
jgi:hypothetical protein